MCKQEIDNIFNLARISIETIKILEKYKDDLINSVTKILFNDKTNFKLLELQNHENQQQFIINIERHFQWILDDCEYLNRDFSAYKDLDEFFNGEYELFYKLATDYVKKLDNIAPEVKNNLIEYFRKIIKSQD